MTIRTIPALLQTHLDTQATTMCYLLKIVPQKVAAFGVTSLDVDVSFDDGGGVLTYQAVSGMNQSSVEAAAGLTVVNSEAMLLIDTEFTSLDIAKGFLDYANFFLYRINWKVPSDGHYLVQSGKTGIVKADGVLSGIIELRGISQQLKQNFVEQYSIPCRAVFGTLVGEGLFPCRFDATSLWANGTIDVVGTEPDREFSVIATPAATGPNGALPFDVAVIEFLTGANAGLTVETETVVVKDITLRFPSPYDIVTGDTFRIRPDCGKRYSDHCVDLFDNGVNFRGEPWIPLTEEAPGSTPGASIPGFGAPAVIP